MRDFRPLGREGDEEAPARWTGAVGFFAEAIRVLRANIAALLRQAEYGSNRGARTTFGVKRFGSTKRHATGPLPAFPYPPSSGMTPRARSR